MLKMVERGELVMISAAKIKQLIERAEANQFTDDDLDSFMRNPGLWRVGTAATLILVGTVEVFWQGVWDELLGQDKATVPPVPKLTERQAKSLERFGFLPMYLPTITEDQYPAGFVKLNWSQYLDASQAERKPLAGQWIAVETIRKPDWDDPVGYPADRLMVALGKALRFGIYWDNLHEKGGILEQVAKVSGFPKKGTRLPSAEEWNLIGNLFNWLRGHRSMPHLPDLGSTSSVEWCANAFGSGSRLIVGAVEGGGLACVNFGWHGGRYDRLAFRVLVVL